MNENFTRDGNGDLVMEEELGDLSYDKHQYTVEDVFVVNIESELIAKMKLP